MRLINSIILFLAILLVLNTFNISLYTEISAFTESPAYNSEIGSFQLSNTSEHNILLERDIYTFNINKIWNLTISVHSNSSEGINISIVRHSGNSNPYIEGTENFQVRVNETHSELYTSILVCDYVQTTNFYYFLSNPNGISSGTYSIEVIDSGQKVNFGTGCVSAKASEGGFLLSFSIIGLLALGKKKKKLTINP
jgi:hypothetical protein